MGRWRQRKNNWRAYPKVRHNRKIPRWTKCWSHHRIWRTKTCIASHPFWNFPSWKDESPGKWYGNLSYRWEKRNWICQEIQSWLSTRYCRWRSNYTTNTSSSRQSDGSSKRQWKDWFDTQRNRSDVYRQDKSVWITSRRYSECRLQKKIPSTQKKHLKLIALENYVVDDVCMQNLIEEEKTFFRAIRFMKKMQIVNSAYWINEQLDGGKSILAEGAQGTLLDVDHGDFPFVTSSNTTIGGVCTGLGIAANRIGKVYGLFKAYCTRVGSGPFPSELGAENSANWCAKKSIEDEKNIYPNVEINNVNTFFKGIALRRKGNEFGATTGRLRRCGWLDMPKLKYACMINGVTDLVISKADVLIGCHTIEVCTSNKNENLHVYRHFDGWMECTLEDINFKKYLTFIEEETKLPIRIISVGPDREQVIIREK